MSRSYRKTPIVGFTCKETEKQFKREENRRRRVAYRSGQEFEPTSYGPKDGRQWLGEDADPKLMRK